MRTVAGSAGFPRPNRRARPFKDKGRSFKPLLSSLAYHWDAKLTCCPKLSKAFGLRRLTVIITDGTGDPWKTQTPGCSSIVTVDDATSRGSPEEGIQYTTCSQHTTAESPRASSSRAAGFAFHTWSFQTEDGDP